MVLQERRVDLQRSYPGEGLPHKRETERPKEPVGYTASQLN
jgi:hypothetical protein